MKTKRKPNKMLSTKSYVYSHLSVYTCKYTRYLEYGLVEVFEFNL